MGVYNSVVDSLFASDAEWRTWAQAYESGLLASGFLIAASDTGQVDLTAAVRPALSSYQGFKMYRAHDALQATRPIFVKVEYGCGTSTARPAVRITVSSSTNGAGTPTGVATAAMVVLAASVDGSGLSRIWAGGDDTCAFVYHYDGTSYSSLGSMFGIGRSILREDKTATDDFIWTGYSATNVSAALSTMNVSVAGGAFSGITPDKAFPYIDQSPNSGGDINSVFCFDAIIYRSARILSYPFVIGRELEMTYADPDASKFSIDVWGSSHQFTTSPWSSMGASGVGKLCFPWNP